MNYTERKYCDTCEEETVHAKDNEEEGVFEECLPCGWREWKKDVEKDLEERGIGEVKKWWVKTRGSELNKQIVKELNPSEKAEWFKIVFWTNKKLGFSPQESPWKNEQELNQPVDYKPYLIGGAIGGGVIAFIWLIVVLAKRD